MNHLDRVLLVIMVVLITAVAATAPAAGAGHGSRSKGRWTAQLAMVPAGGDPEGLFFSATECPSTTTCVSVGGDDGPVARSLVAGQETTVRVPVPAEAASARVGLGLLSCASATFCVSSGIYRTEDLDDVGFFARWDGSTWRSVRAPDPAPDDDDHGRLAGLSCGAPGSCTAVSTGTVYTLSGGRWTAEAPLPPTGTDNLHLERVSCASAASCVITGSAYADAGRVPIVIVRDGAATTSLRLPNPPGWTGVDFGPTLMGLDCAAPGHCVIVAGAPLQPRYLVTLDGTHAVYHRVPNPADGEPNAYRSFDDDNPISCPTASTCWELDSYLPRGEPDPLQTVPVAVRLRRGKVTVSGLPEAAPQREARSELNDLDCPSATWCVAVGSRRTDDGTSYREAVAVGLRRGVWRSSRIPIPDGTPPPPRSYGLNAVACGAPTRCAAHGTYQWDPTSGGEDAEFAHRRAVLAQLTPFGCAPWRGSRPER